MPVPTLITDLSTTASANYPSGSDTPAILDDVQRAHASFIAKLRDESARSEQIGNFQGALAVSSGLTLTVADVGKAITINSGGFLNLPLGATVPVGASFLIGSTAAGRGVSRQGADLISTLAGTGTVTTVVLDAGDTLQVVWNGSGWIAMSGTAQMRYSTKFAAQLAASGYQRLPSGLIIQWLQVTNLGAPGGVAAFPIAFPTSALAVSTWVNNGNSPRYMSTVLINNATFAAYADAYPCGFGFIAIGY